MLGTRLDIVFAVTQLTHHTSNSSQDHLNKVLYICHYLVNTQHYSLVYSRDSKLRIYACTDSDWASNPKDQKSQTRYFLMIAGSAFSWILRAQKAVVLFSTEAEYIALLDCSCQCIWIHLIQTELNYRFGPIHISGDNQGLIFMSSNPVTESRNKHIDIHFHAIQNFVT